MQNDFTDPAGRSATAQTPSSSPAFGSSQGSRTSISDLEAKVSEDVSAVKETIKEGADTAVEKAKQVISERTSFAARQVGGVATALEKAGAEMESSGQAEVGRYARQIGRSVQTVARRMEGKDIGEIATMAEDFGRKQPLAFLGIAALAGLAASRFLTASANRQTAAAPREPSIGLRPGAASTGGENNG
ncbi:nutrient deprivation-induced protein [Rhizobium lentis]|uniref:nutrient deprivation-induced protein n=1 Tax=Rhizobium lentis TaxID=1138194 RepID=UPI001C83B9E9|nr:nutrient deprivation-induced protein [Rhizobium lentis]MBX5042619.1 nutrient deprivation-induced protein [Rhizobium lentis]MBX5051145.1 nutrient deprivation-induced protein [Rhizobium lentis]MBX5072453.1 nutrient deprivation-induced protein [Rhizobium lentis]MBX5106456.1 nutrient deprivation-induced protein [Rhizobium lentis]MBX5113217.1 nutrient deprivation-induced protein [Rhizobium lentis]